MKISDVRVRIVKKEDSKLKAVASITIDDCFVVHDVSTGGCLYPLGPVQPDETGITMSLDDGHSPALPARGLFSLPVTNRGVPDDS